MVENEKWFNCNWKRVTWHCQSRLILCLGRWVACTWRHHPISTAKVGPCKTLARVSKHQRKMRVRLIWFWNQTCSLLIFFFARKRASGSTIGWPLSHMSCYNGATVTCLCFYHGFFSGGFQQHRNTSSVRLGRLPIFWWFVFLLGEGRQTHTTCMQLQGNSQATFTEPEWWLFYRNQMPVVAAWIYMSTRLLTSWWNKISINFNSLSCMFPTISWSIWLGSSHWRDKKKYGHALHHPIFLTLDQVLPLSFPREGGMSRWLVGRQENVLGLQVGVGHLAARKGGGHITSVIAALDWSIVKDQSMPINNLAC